MGARPGALARLCAVLPPALPTQRFARLRAMLFALALLPLARLVYLAATGGLGAHPVEFVTRSLGTWGLVLLCVTLAISPLRHWTGWAWLLRLRRMAGLFCFFYVLLHVSAYALLDLGLDLRAIGADLARRPFIGAGFAAFVLLIPLAATSSNAMVGRLGARRWQRLHRLVYPIALLAILHYWWQKSAKNDLTEPLVYALVVGALLGVRLARWLSAR